jgi:adenosine deaminase
MPISQLPKVELHLHLDCSLSFAVVSQINPSITIERYQAEFIAPDKCVDLMDYLTRAPSSFPLMQTAEHLRLVVLDLFKQLQNDNVIYAEIRFAPLLHTEGGLTPREVVASVEAAVAEAVQATGIEARIILCTLRYFSPAQSLATVKLVEEFQGTYVAAFDIAADKPGDVISDHMAAFKYARENSIPFTAHVGETRGVQNFWDTLQAFAPKRVGHGVCCIEDPELLELVKNEQIHLEACPTCNVQTDCYETYADHPIDRLYRAGVSIGVNTDTRTITNISLTQEYEKLQGTFNWGIEDFYNCNVNALNAAFITDELRERLLSKLSTYYQAAL